MAKLALLPANIFAEGSYSLKQRIGAGVYKGVLFGLCGFMGSVGGTSLAYLLFLVRRITNPSSAKDGKELPNVLANSLGWASFMFVSTNPRYQLVNGFEQVFPSSDDLRFFNYLLEFRILEPTICLRSRFSP